jgi:hypothetical protein
MGARLAFILALVGCSSDLQPIIECESAFGITVDCRFDAPEDLVVGPGGEYLIVSQLGGSLVGYRISDRDIIQLFPTDERPPAEWGDPACGFPDHFSPQGIDLERRDDGRYQLLVVNHGGRESVEFFEVLAERVLVWRGCVEGPKDSFFNDLVVLRSGGFWVTHMFPKDDLIWPLIKAGVFGFDTGWVYAWSLESGFSKLPGSDGPFPNGIEKSSDERFVFINSYAPGGVRKVDVTSGELVAAREMPPVDNSSWSPDGKLIVAAHTGSLMDMLTCRQFDEGACGLAFEVIALDPADLHTENVLIANEGVPLGAVSTAVQVGSTFYLGSFMGDRIGIVDFESFP